MMTKLGKAATVATATFAVLVCGVAVAVLMGGPNWVGMTQSIDGYSFVYTGGETPNWTATSDLDGATVKQSPILPDVIPPVLDQKLTTIDAKAKQIADRRTLLDRQIEVATQTSALDKKALGARIEQLRSEIEEINQTTASTSAELLQVNEEIAGIEAAIEDRRGDVLRSDALVKIVDADIHRARQLRQQMADLISQIDADLATAERREQQLRQLLGQTTQ